MYKGGMNFFAKKLSHSAEKRWVAFYVLKKTLDSKNLVNLRCVTILVGKFGLTVPKNSIVGTL